MVLVRYWTSGTCACILVQDFIFLQSHVFLVPGEGIVVSYLLIVTCGVCVFFFRQPSATACFRLFSHPWSLKVKSRWEGSVVIFWNSSWQMSLGAALGYPRGWLLTNPESCGETVIKYKNDWGCLFIWNIRVTWSRELCWWVRGVLNDKKKYMSVY